MCAIICTTILDLIHAGTGNDDIDDDTANNVNDVIDRESQIHGLGNKRWSMEQLQPQHRSNFVYGSTLTPLPTIYHRKSQQQQQKESDDDDEGDEGDDDKDKSGMKIMESTTKEIATEDDDNNNNMNSSSSSSSKSPSNIVVIAEMRALRFGGFRAGGYSNETQQVSMLTIKEVVVEEDITSLPTRRRTGFPGQFFQRQRQEQQQQRSLSSSTWVADWTDIPTTLPSPGVVDLSRAYHSATLLLNRYLVIIGGMKCTYIYIYIAKKLLY